MPSMNVVMVQGHLGRDPEMRQTGTGKTVANFSVACSKRYESGGEWKETTTWVRCVAWGKQAEIMAGVRKGDLVYVQGDLQSRKYAPKDGGPEREIVEVNAQFIHALNRGERAPAPARSQRTDDEIPF